MTVAPTAQTTMGRLRAMSVDPEAGGDTSQIARAIGATGREGPALRSIGDEAGAGKERGDTARVEAGPVPAPFFLARGADVTTLLAALGIPEFPYRSFHNPPVRLPLAATAEDAASHVGTVRSLSRKCDAAAVGEEEGLGTRLVDGGADAKTDDRRMGKVIAFPVGRTMAVGPTLARLRPPVLGSSTARMTTLRSLVGSAQQPVVSADETTFPAVPRPDPARAPTTMRRLVAEPWEPTVAGGASNRECRHGSVGLGNSTLAALLQSCRMEARGLGGGT